MFVVLPLLVCAACLVIRLCWRLQTFGLKNKKKSKKVQQFVAQVEKMATDGGPRRKVSAPSALWELPCQLEPAFAGCCLIRSQHALCCLPFQCPNLRCVAA